MKFTFLTAAVALFLSAPAQAESFENTMPPKLKTAQTEEVMTAVEKKMEMAPVTAVAFHSDNCGSCKILGPRMMEAMSIINAKKVDVVKFDLTNEKSIEETQALANEKGVSDVLQKYGKKTGFVVVLNNKGEEVDTLKVDHDTGEIASKLVIAVANAS